MYFSEKEKRYSREKGTGMRDQDPPLPLLQTLPKFLYFTSVPVQHHRVCAHYTLHLDQYMLLAYTTQVNSA